MESRSEIKEYLRKHGTRTLSVLVAELVRRAPEFPGDSKLAEELGVVVADLEFALEAEYIRLFY